MPVHARRAARLLAGALALTLLPAFALAQESAPTVNPWKLAYARRMADERMEEREARERRDTPAQRRERARRLRALARELARSGKSALRVHGDRAVPAPRDPRAGVGPVAPPTRAARTFNARAFTTPANHIVNDRSGEGPETGQSETSIAAVGDKMVAAWNDFFLSPGDTQGWGTSIDGGITWIDQGTFPHATGVSNFTWTSDPVLTANEKTDAFYFSALCDFNDVNGARSGIAVVKGRFNGTSFTWGTPQIAVNLPSPEPDKEWIAADSVSGRVYLTYARFPASGGDMIDFEWADSNVAAWSAPRQISLNNVSENGFVQGARPIVDGDGRVYVVYELIGSGFSDYYKICHSNDGGVTFSSPVVAESLYTNFGTGSPGYNRDHGVEFSGIAVDRSHGPQRGRIYLSWAESLNWLDEVFTLGGTSNKSESEPNGTTGTATPITIGQTVRGSIADFSDIDLYSFPLVQGQAIAIAADSTQSPLQIPLSMQLLAGDGVSRLAFNTFDLTVNSAPGQPEGFPAGWMFTAPTTGTYYLRLASFPGSGSYRLRTGFVHRGTERGRDQRDVFVGWSDDGASWSDPNRINEDPPGFDQFLPEVAVAPDGGVYCSWYDYRDSPASTDGGEASVYLARSGDGGFTWTTLGSVSDTLSNWTTALTDVIPNQGDYMALIATSSQIQPLWSDARRGNPDVFTARIPLIPNGAQVAFQTVQLGSGRIRMSWLATPADTLTMRLYRSVDSGPYQFLDVVQFDAGGALAYTDTTALGNHGYAYRLGKFTNGIELFYGQVRVFLPGSFPLVMLAPRPNPVTGNSFVASFSLATDAPADLKLFDLSGREVFRERVNAGMGPHTLTLSVGHGLHQGLYVLTLRQGGHNASTRVFLVR